MRAKIAIAAVLFATGAAAPLSAAETASATMVGPDGSEMGVVTLTQAPKGVLISARLSGLSPGAHGFHIHETGNCAPDFGAAGGHFNPAGTGHGILNEGGHHAGDLTNIVAAADGTASADWFTGDVAFDPAAQNALFDADGSAVIVHESPDSYGADAGAGGRVACGVITMN